MRTALAIALGLLSAAALAQVGQPGNPPPAGTSTAGVTPLAIPDAGRAQTSLQASSDGGPATRTARTGDEASTQPAQRIYSFDPLPVGSYSFEAPATAPTSQSSPSSSPR